MMDEFEIILDKYLKKIEININKNQVNKFYNYMNLLIEGNKKVNLTAITEQNDIILKHFVDSLTILKYINKGQKIVDVGTGAGFPGIPLAIMDDSINITLLDSLNKRIKFLDEVIKKIGLQNVVAIHSRAEEFGQNKKYRESFDIAFSRAVANLSVLSEYLLPLVKVGGKVICMKGQNIKEEINDAQLAIKKLGGNIVDVSEFCLPDSNMTRNIIIIEKIKNTDKKYPRKAGIPSKVPLR